MIVAVGVISLLMIFVVPQLVGLFAHTKAQLPVLTKMLIALSYFFSHYLWIAVLILIALVVGVQRLLRDAGRRRLWHRFLLKVPFVSGLITAMDTARFASTLSILTSSGVPLLEGLRIAGEVLTNIELREASKQVAIAVQEGGSLNRALAQTGVFPPMMVHMVASGEASGELEAMLSRSALNQERELEMTLGSLMAIMEPLMVIIMAGGCRYDRAGDFAADYSDEQTRGVIKIMKQGVGFMEIRFMSNVNAMKNKRGFSLVEILVVLVIIGLLVSIVAPNVLQRADEARVQKVRADFKNIETALKLYKLDNFNYPSTEQGLAALVEKPSMDPIPRNWKQGGYLEKVPDDPWGNPYKYLSPPEFGHGDYDIYTLGADGVTGGEDQNADLGNWQTDQKEQQ